MTDSAATAHPRLGWRAFVQASGVRVTKAPIYACEIETTGRQAKFVVRRMNERR